MKRAKNILITLLAISVVLVGFKVYSLYDELSEYKAVYDDLKLYEDGSWVYDEGVSEYYFWNWELDYVGK